MRSCIHILFLQFHLQISSTAKITSDSLVSLQRSREASNIIISLLILQASPGAASKTTTNVTASKTTYGAASKTASQTTTTAVKATASATKTTTATSPTGTKTSHSAATAGSASKESKDEKNDVKPTDNKEVD